MHDAKVPASESLGQSRYDRLTQPAPISEQAWPADVTPVVSVCCVTYNHGPFVRQCLDGFLMQETTFPVEILLHDDASTDDTAAVIREYAERHPALFKPILQTENQYSKGVSPNIQFNIPRARGRYIALCEGDDYWTDPRKLQLQADFLERNPEYVICYHDAEVVDESGLVINESLLKDEWKRDYSADDLRLAAWTATLTRCYRNIRVDIPEEFNRVVSRDIFSTVLLGRHGKGKYIDSIRPARYRQHSGGVYSGRSKEDQALGSFDSRLYMYLYHRRVSGKEFALRFLSERVLPLAEGIEPGANPITRKISRLQDELRQLRTSRTYRLGCVLTHPAKTLLKLLSSRGWRRGVLADLADSRDSPRNP